MSLIEFSKIKKNRVLTLAQHHSKGQIYTLIDRVIAVLAFACVGRSQPQLTPAAVMAQMPKVDGFLGFSRRQDATPTAEHWRCPHFGQSGASSGLWQGWQLQQRLLQPFMLH
jgi:hypothetical protein